LPFLSQVAKMGVMDPRWQVVIWLLALMGLLYLFFAIYTIIVLFDFKGKLRKRLVALSILFAEKKEILLALYTLYQKAKLPLEGDIVRLRYQVAALQTEPQNEKEAMDITILLNEFQRRLSLLSEEERYIQKSGDFLSYMNTLKDLENNYHRIVAAYNTDLNGYEYWRKRTVYCWLTWLFGFRKRQRLA
jgi:hypothetical protein